MKWTLLAPALMTLTACGGSGSLAPTTAPADTQSTAVRAATGSATDDLTTQETQTTGDTTTVAFALINDMDALDSDFGRLLNSVRLENGAGSVSYDSRLDAAAQAHAEDMINQDYFSHTGLNGSTVKDRIDAQGYDARAWGENLAAGQQSAEDAVTGWENSPGHFRMMTADSLEDFGFGFANEGRDTRWVLVMGTER